MTTVIAMPCPKCSGKMETRDSRPTTHRGAPSVRRRRHCVKCRYRITTFEIQDTGDDFEHETLPKVIGAARTANELLTNLIAQFDGMSASAKEPT